MASKKNDKSTKTAHVLNLLAPSHEEPPAAPVEEGQPAPPPAPSRPLTPPILEVAKNNDEQLAGQIQNALAEELEELGKGIHCIIKVQREDIFDKMHRI